MLAPVLDAVQPIRQCRGRPRCRPAKLHADKAYDHAACRRACRDRRIVPRMARRGVDGSERLRRHRWIVERTLAWFAHFRRLAVRYQRRLAGPIRASAVVARRRHLATVFGFSPKRAAKLRVVVCAVWSSARTRGVVRAEP